MKRLETKTAVVTGGGAGIGAACVAKLLDEGAKVLLVELDDLAIERARGALGGAESVLRVSRRDISREDERRAAIEEAIEWSGSCDVLVNNAAAFVMKGIEADVADWHHNYEINVVACARLAHWMANFGRFSNPDRAIVNICSISSTLAQAEFATYNASKGALLTFTKCMALDLASYGIRVNSVSPGTIWTESNEEHIQRRFGLDRVGANNHPELGGKHILRRLGDPFEVANAVAFLASSEASFITGANLYVDGGYSII